MNTVKQGTVGVASAIFEFCKRDWFVSIPINDIQKYDLVLDQGNGLKKVQVKTTKSKMHNNYVVQLKTILTNKNINIIKNLDTSNIDYLFILCEDSSKYFIPSNKIASKCALSLGKKYEEYKL